MKKFFIGLGLLVVSMILLIPLFIWGLFESLFKAFHKRKIGKGFGQLGDILRQMAISLDMFGNVIMKHAMNRMLKTKDGYKFGSYDETISFVLGMNQVDGTLTKLGLWLSNKLNFFEPDHCIVTVENKLRRYETR